MPVRRLVLALLPLLVAGCAAIEVAREPVKGTGQLPDRFKLADGREMQCRMEKPTGSNIPERVCEPVQGSSVLRKQANSELLEKPAMQTIKGN